MGTVLKSFNQWREGLLLLESFESPSFMLDQAWTLLNGTPARSNTVAFSGLYSLEMDDTYAWIERDFSVLDLDYEFSVVYFFDDAAVISGGYTPFVEWETSTGQIFGLGVDLAVSTDFYTAMMDGVKSISLIPRSSGWHRFNLIYSRLSGTPYALIDGAEAWYFVGAASTFTRIRVGAQVASGDPPFGYFDLVQCNLNAALYVYGVPQGSVGYLYDEDGVLINMTFPAAVAGVLLFDVISENSTFNGYIVLRSKADGIQFFRSPTQAFSIGDMYVYNSYDFGRKPTAFGPTNAAARNDLKSILGVKQSVFFNDSDRVTMTFEDLTEEQKNELDRWWTSAKKGDTFSVAIDGNNTYYGTVTADNYEPLSAAVEVDSALQLEASAVLVVRDNDGSSKQTVKVASVDLLTNTFIMTRPPVAPILAGQQVRSQYYWPFCTSTESTLRMILSNLKQKRWTVSLSFEEAIQP